MLMYVCVYSLYTCDNHTQWNLSITDTLGPEEQFVVQRFPLLRSYFIYTIIYLDP